MKHLIGCILIIIVSGCQNPLQEYIIERTFVNLNYGTNGYTITVSVESAVEFDDSIMPDLVWIQRHIAETILPDNDELKYFTLFIPVNENSFLNARKCTTESNKSTAVAFIVPRSKIVVFNPKMLHERSIEYIVETYIHELMHYVAMQIDGNGDTNHERIEYWGKDGLVDIIYNEWIDKH